MQFISRRSNMERKKRIVMAKTGLDGHDRGVKVVAKTLADAGFEVIYTGKFQTPGQVVLTAIQENADAIGISLLSGAHMTLFRKVIDFLKEKQAADIVVFGGGVIMDEDILKLKEMGVAEIFPPDTAMEKIVDFVKNIPVRA